MSCSLFGLHELSNTYLAAIMTVTETALKGAYIIDIEPIEQPRTNSCWRASGPGGTTISSSPPRASGFADELVFTGYVPDEDLVALYNAADLFVYPSIFEGFGLPPLEAMACGTPVVCSNTSSFPEVVGDAALTVDPLDPEALARAIAALLNDADLRAQLSKLGLRRVGTFLWEHTMHATLRVYRGLA